MPRPVLLFSGQWTDLTLEELVAKVTDWGYQGLELCCWGDHFEVQRSLSEDDYCAKKLDLLARHDLQVHVLACHRVSQALCDVIDSRHRQILPDYVWGDGKPESVRQRAVAEMLATVQAAQKLGAGVISGFSGSPIWSYVVGYPAVDEDKVSEAFQQFTRIWTPILDACRDANLRFAYEVHPGQLAFDLYSAEMLLDAIDGREEFGFTFDPSHLHWLGLDPVELIRRFPDRIYHVHIKDVTIHLNGRTSLLNAYLPNGDPRRGWNFRSPGRGGVDWESVIRALNDVGYEGPLSVEWKDAGMDRDAGAEEACQFVKRLDFPPAPRSGSGPAFR